MAKISVFNIVPMDNAYYAHFQGVRFFSEEINDAKQEVTPKEELYPLLENTVLHSLAHPKDDMDFVFEYMGEKITLPVPAIGSVFDLECHTVYDDAGLFLGSSIRLPPLHTSVNAVLTALQKGLSPDINALYKSYLNSMRNLVVERIISTRVPLGINGVFMCGDQFLQRDELAITKELASMFIKSYIKNLYRSSKKNGVYSRQYKNMAENLEKRFQEFGPGIVSGMKDMVGKREPATSYGTLKRFTVHVVDCPGKAIYCTTQMIHDAGGKPFMLS